MGFPRQIHITKKAIIALTFVMAMLMVLAGNPSFAQPAQNCEELYQFRDTQLVQQWDAAAAKYKIPAEILREYGSRKAKLLDETRWVTSDSFSFLSSMAAGTKLLADLINDGIGIAVPAKSALTRGASATAATVYNGLKEFGRVHTLAYDMSVKNLAKEALNNINPVTQSVRLVWNFADNLKTLSDITEDQKKIIRMVRDQLKTMEREIAKYQASLEHSQRKIEFINAFREGIDRYCQEATEQASIPGPSGSVRSSGDLRGTWRCVETFKYETFTSRCDNTCNVRDKTGPNTYDGTCTINNCTNTAAPGYSMKPGPGHVSVTCAVRFRLKGNRLTEISSGPNTRSYDCNGTFENTFDGNSWSWRGTDADGRGSGSLICRRQ